MKKEVGEFIFKLLFIHAAVNIAIKLLNQINQIIEKYLYYAVEFQSIL